MSKQPPIFYLSQPHACNYLHDRQMIMLFVEPDYPFDIESCTQLARQGFRRSGNLIYRPHCHECTACIPVRIPVNNFRPSRSQKRAWRKNQDLSIKALPPAFNEDHFALYCRYLRARHPGGGMDDSSPEKYLEFLTSACTPVIFYEMRANDCLLAVAVVDQLTDGLSAVYTFYDPDAQKRSLGVFSILWEIEEARRQQLTWLYLGYWIETCPSMAYKNAYRPLQIYRDDHWLDYVDQ